MDKDEGRLQTSNPETNKIIENMTETEYQKWSKPILQVFEELDEIFEEEAE